MVAGAAAGPVLIDALINVGGDQLERLLSEGEAGRVKLLLKLAGAEIGRRYGNGHLPRSDLHENAHRTAEELFEATLLKARSTYEAAKLRHLAHFMVDVLFDSEADIHAALHLLNLAERLTYQQYLLVALFDRRITARDLGSEPFGDVPQREARELMLPLAELFDVGLLQEGDGSEDVFVGQLAARYNASSISLSLPNEIRLSLAGQLLADRLELDKVPEDRLDELASRFRSSKR